MPLLGLELLEQALPTHQGKLSGINDFLLIDLRCHAILLKEENPPKDSPYKTPSEGEKWTSNDNFWGGKRLFKPTGNLICL